MDRLFAQLYLDEDVDVLVAELLRARGFEVLTTQEAGALGNTDEAQLQFAIERRRVFVTHNRVDFEAAAISLFEASRSHTGIIVATRNPPYEIARRLLVLLNQLTQDEFADQLLYI